MGRGGWGNSEKRADFHRDNVVSLFLVSSEVWMHYIRFELENAAGDANRVAQLHYRAKLSLNAGAVDQFLEQYTLLQLQAWGFSISGVRPFPRICFPQSFCVLFLLLFLLYVCFTLVLIASNGWMIQNNYWKLSTHARAHIHTHTRTERKCDRVPIKKKPTPK